MIQKCKNLTLMRWRSLPTLSSLAAAQPGSSVQQLIQLNYTYFIFAFVKLKDKYYFLLIKQCITLISDIILSNTFLNQTNIMAVFNKKNVKRIFISKNKSIFTFNDIGLNTHRFDQKMN